MKRSKDNFLLILSACVVIIVSFLIISKHVTADEVIARVEGARTYKSDTAADLMKQLRQTVDDGGAAELKRLKNDAGGL